MKKNDEGFTLIELLIVIVILGILAAVVVFAVGGITDTGEENACETEQRTVETAVEAYRAQNGVYPPNGTSDLTANNAFLRSTPTWWTVGAGTGAVTFQAPAGSTATSCATL